MNIIPRPLKATIMSGAAIIGANSKIIGAEKFALTSEYLACLISGLGNAADAVDINILSQSAMASEEYNLSVADNKINITASSDIGALNAVKSLAQIIISNSVQACEIVDKPKYSWRGFMLDCARHYWCVDYIKKTLDVMAALKLNIFHWHITDDQGWRIEIIKHPDLAIKGCKRNNTQLHPNKADHDNTPYGEGLYYTQVQIKEVVDYAAKLGINVVPEIDMPGHLVAAISVYPELSCEGKQIDVSTHWGVLDTIGCGGSDVLYRFIDDILDEVCALFPYNYFHIGGDEVPKTKWKTCPKCQAKMKELGLENEQELQGYFNNYVADYIKKYNKKLVGWNEVLHAKTLNKDTVIQWWTPGDKERCIRWINNGGKAILSRHQNFYMDHSYACRPLKKTYSFNYKMLGIKSDDGILGIEAPQWVEYIKTIDKIEFNTYPRMMALADVAWTKPYYKNYNEFEMRLESLRGYFEGKFAIKMASQHYYRGKSVKCPIMRTAIAWAKWGVNPDNEIELVRQGK